MEPGKLWGLGFLVGGMYVAQLLGTYMSSPWTLANVGADEEHALTAKQLIGTSVIIGVAAGALAAKVDNNPGIIVGVAVTGALTIGVYGWAINKAQKKGYQGLNQGMSQKG